MTERSGWIEVGHCRGRGGAGFSAAVAFSDVGALLAIASSGKICPVLTIGGSSGDDL